MLEPAMERVGRPCIGFVGYFRIERGALRFQQFVERAPAVRVVNAVAFQPGESIFANRIGIPCVG